MGSENNDTAFTTEVARRRLAGEDIRCCWHCLHLEYNERYCALKQKDPCPSSPTFMNTRCPEFELGRNKLWVKGYYP